MPLSLLLLAALCCCIISCANAAQGKSASANYATDFSRAVDNDVFLNFTQIVQARGYPVESHRVTTADGYILTMFRIPHGRNNAQTNARKPPVILQHGLLDSSFTWIVNMPDQSLSFILADAGYDVWMGNSRGNIYSLDHVNMSTSDPKFWDFSWDDMAEHDIPAVLSYVSRFTGYPKVAYVGHSQGTIQMFAALSTQTHLADKLTTFIGFGPVAFVTHEKALALRVLADLDFDVWVKYFGFTDFLPDINREKDPLVYFLFEAFCTECGFCCADVIELLCGPHNGAFNNSRMPVVATHEPGGTSVENMMHWAQGVRSGKFQMFDYGSAENMKRYNQTTPPQYNLGKISPTLSIALYSGGEDILADPTDVANLVHLLPTPSNKFYWQQIPDYAHLDFAWALDAPTVMYKKVLEQIKASYL